MKGINGGMNAQEAGRRARDYNECFVSPTIWLRFPARIHYSCFDAGVFVSRAWIVSMPMGGEEISSERRSTSFLLRYKASLMPIFNTFADF